jgi:hypothetical protein
MSWRVSGVDGAAAVPLLQDVHTSVERLHVALQGTADLSSFERFMQAGM